MIEDWDDVCKDGNLGVVYWRFLRIWVIFLKLIYWVDCFEWFNIRGYCFKYIFFFYKECIF